jgi:hypothetical protein
MRAMLQPVDMDQLKNRLGEIFTNTLTENPDADDKLDALVGYEADWVAYDVGFGGPYHNQQLYVMNPEDKRAGELFGRWIPHQDLKFHEVLEGGANE